MNATLFIIAVLVALGGIGTIIFHQIIKKRKSFLHLLILILMIFVLIILAFVGIELSIHKFKMEEFNVYSLTYLGEIVLLFVYYYFQKYKTYKHIEELNLGLSLEK